MGNYTDLTIVLFVTGEYRHVLRDVVVPSLISRHPELSAENIVVQLNEELVDLAGQTQNTVYKEMMLHRQQFYLTMVRENMGNKLLFLDCDVVCTQPFLDEISHILDTCDFAMQKNYIAGIWGVSCNENTLAFFEDFVKSIESIPPDARQDGYPQFELEACIENARAKQQLNVVTLPPKYGYLCPEMVIYHAINGGQTAQAKLLILMTICHFWGMATHFNWKELFDGSCHWGNYPDENESFFTEEAENTLNWFAAYRESDMPAIKAILEDPDTTTWIPTASYSINQGELLKTLLIDKESIYMYVAASWCDLTRTPRLILTVRPDDLIGWLGYPSIAAYVDAQRKGI